MRALARPRRSDFRAKTRRRTVIARRNVGFVRTSGYYRRYEGTGRREKKFFDTNVGDVILEINTGLQKVALCQVAQGDQENQRIGRKIMVSACYFRGRVRIKSTAVPTDTSEYVRLLLVEDKQTNGAIFLTNDLFDTTAPASAKNVFAFNNLSNKDRFKVHYDQQFCVSTMGGGIAASTSSAEFTVCIDWFKKFPRPIEIEYDPSLTTGAISTIRSRNLVFCITAEDGDIAVLGGVVRIRYTD